MSGDFRYEQSMVIRKANADDSKLIATYMLLAMQDIFFQFIGEDSIEKATQALEFLVRQEVNQYSYEYCWVVEDEEEIIAVANVYDGAKLHELRKPVADLIQSMFHRDFHPEDETQTGEFYIDCIGVHPAHQGKGIGSKLVQFLIDEYVEKNKLTLGLLVDKNNPSAKRLYLQLGFKAVGEKTLMGKRLEHLQIRSIL